MFNGLVDTYVQHPERQHGSLASASHLSATGPDGYAAKTAVELYQIRKRFRGVVVLQQIAPNPAGRL
jgi:hypothetical protein